MMRLSLEKARINQKERIKHYLEYEMKPFKTIDDIPNIPILDNSNDYKECVVKNFIRCGAIPKKDLIVGKTYIGDCRNSSEAIWNGDKFFYKRNKFGIIFEDTINHFEDDNGFDLFVPIKEKN